MRPCYDWSPLGLPADPAPGDPDLVQSQAAVLRGSAQSISEAAANLRSIQGADGVKSLAIAKIMVKADELAGQLDQASTRYQGAGDALAGYVPALRHAQSESVAALNAAASAGPTEKAAYQESLGHWWAAKTSLDPVDREEAIARFHKSNAKREHAKAELAAAKAKLQKALEQRDQAAEIAAGQIDVANKASGLNDSAWDKFLHFIQPAVDVVVTAGKWIWDNIDMISTVLNILAPVLGPIPVLGPVVGALAAVAGALALIKGAYTTLSAVGQGIQTGNWGPAILAGATLILTSKLGGVGKKAVGSLASSLGAKAGQAAGKLAKKGVGVYQQWLKTSVTASKSSLYKATFMTQGGTSKVMQNALKQAYHTPAYHAGAANVEKLYRASNQAVRDIAPRIDAITSINRGGDFLPIKNHLDDLARLSKMPDISPQTAQFISDLSEGVVGGAVEHVVNDLGEQAVDTAVDAAQEAIVDAYAQHIGEHRVGEQVCR